MKRTTRKHGWGERWTDPTKGNDDGRKEEEERVRPRASIAPGYYKRHGGVGSRRGEEEAGGVGWRGQDVNT